MQALILAAGMGKRLKELTKDNTKCMIKVNGVTLIERMLTQLDILGLKKILIVVGYEGRKLTDFISTLKIRTQIIYINNPIYYKTNNIYSLSLAKDYLKEDNTLLLESDLIFEDNVLKSLIEDDRETLALVDKYESWMDGTVVKLDNEDNIQEFIPGKRFVFADISKYYKTVNIYKFSKHFSSLYYIPFLEAYSMALGNNEYYEQVLRVITMLDKSEIQAKRLVGQLWYEIDDVQDLDIAESIFTQSSEDKLTKIQSRYGGYWRYPKLLDFCYLVNPYFPPQRLIDEIKSNFETLLTQYPSGSEVNSLLASKNFGVKPEFIIVGNGAAELIKAIMANMSGKVGFITPTFEEYPNRLSDEDKIIYNVEDHFSYNTDDIIAFFSDKQIKMLVLINPDNPSGNYIVKQEVLNLCKWASQNDICLLFDESFIDFADEADGSLLDNSILYEYSNLIVIKSISKSFGVPGIRLGIAASSNIILIKKLKQDLSIWNINSIAEFYLQIIEKYNNDYWIGVDKFKKTRNIFIAQLKKVSLLNVFPTQANYVMCEVVGGKTSKWVAQILLDKYNIFVKDLTPKINNEKQYLRLAIRTDIENEILLKALLDILI